MSKSHRYSSASATCRLEWRPSRLIIAWLGLLAVLSPISLLASGLPRGLAWPLAVIAMLYALWEAQRYRVSPPRLLVVTVEGPLLVDGQSFAHWRLRWRGSWAFVTWRDDAGRRQALAFWPDTLSNGQRRELRLATPNDVSISPTVGMAT